MRAMKDSGIDWIGEIPQGWNLCRIKTLFEIIGGNGFKEHLQGNESGDYPFYKVSDINGDSTHSGRAANYITSLTAKEYAFNLVPSKSIIMSKIGEALKKNHRKISSTDCFIDNNLQALVPIADIDEVFYYYVLCCINMEWFDNGGTIPSVNNQKLRDFKIPLPTKNQQISIGQRIQKKCAEIDALIAAKEKTNALLKERRQSIIYEAVTKGLDPTVPMKDSGVEWIGEIPEGWSTWRMKHLAVEPLQYGANATGIEYDSDLPRYVRITDITPDRKLNDEGKQSLPESIARDYMLVPGDILFARSGATSGKSFYYDENYGECCFAGYLIRFRPDAHKANSRFLYYYTLTLAYEQWTQQIFIQATIQNISAEKYNNLVFAIPSTLDEQAEIVAYLDAKCGKLDQIISGNESTIQKLKEYRQSLIYEAVTGKIEV